ncbi:phenazine biosynthesis protein [Affinibrenneria salicis]|uniref:Phenazine antibiotic resistance protein n=1 Tax=Affinibrenneria salicis TaxID=2590031 RepID=A0A5J5FYU5_9GAMM|nr:VOC family protein [Affinibrenneria salicis]KAA8999400.1 phenazine biosynthesis protein [Affinibrenneria salicis]
MFKPNSLILYVQDVAVSARFYADILAREPAESFPDFTLFSLDHDFSLGLQTRDEIFPPAQPQVGGTELCFSKATDEDVDRLYQTWRDKAVTMVTPPVRLEFGYTFVAQDPDGHRLRVCATDVSSFV